MAKDVVAAQPEHVERRGAKYVVIRLEMDDGKRNRRDGCGLTLRGKFDTTFGIKVETEPEGSQVLACDALLLTENEFKFRRKQAGDCNHVFTLKLADDAPDPEVVMSGNAVITRVAYQEHE